MDHSVAPDMAGRPEGQDGLIMAAMMALAKGSLATGSLATGAVRVDQAAQPLEGGDDPAFGTVRWRTLFCADRTATAGVVVGIA